MFDTLIYKYNVLYLSNKKIILYNNGFRNGSNYSIYVIYTLLNW